VEEVVIGGGGLGLSICIILKFLFALHDTVVPVRGVYSVKNQGAERTAPMRETEGPFQVDERGTWTVLCGVCGLVAKFGFYAQLDSKRREMLVCLSLCCNDKCLNNSKPRCYVAALI
jgi:hypothetical protein